jgi:hypothetical protein
MRASSAVRVAALIVTAKAVVLGLVWQEWADILAGQPHTQCAHTARWLIGLAVLIAVLSALIIALHNRHRPTL